VPSNVSDMAGLIATAMTVVKGPGAPGK
jgi:hypothetical protein